MAQACTRLDLGDPTATEQRTFAAPRTFLAQLRLHLRPVATALLASELPADREYSTLLNASGGRFTDALEREADRRMRSSENW